MRSHDADRDDDDGDYDDEDSADDYAYIGGTRDDEYDYDDDVVRTDGNACTPAFFTYSFCLGAWAWSQHHSATTNAVYHTFDNPRTDCDVGVLTVWGKVI